MKRIIRERNPESKFGMNSKKADQSFRDIYDDFNTEHDKCSIALGGEMSENKYQDMHDLIAPTAKNDVPHVPSSVSEALGDDATSSENIATEESIQPIVGEVSESTVRYRPGPKSRKKYLVVRESDPIKESLKRKSESHGEQPSLSMESDFDDTILNEDIDDLLDDESPELSNDDGAALDTSNLGLEIVSTLVVHTVLLMNSLILQLKILN